MFHDAVKTVLTCSWLHHTHIQLFIIQRLCVCVSSSCRVFGQQTSLMAPVWLSTTSTDWWPLAVPGTCLCVTVCLYLYNVVLGGKCGCICLHLCVTEVVVHLVCVCPVWEPVSLCLPRLASVCLSEIVQYPSLAEMFAGLFSPLSYFLQICLCFVLYGSMHTHSSFCNTIREVIVKLRLYKLCGQVKHLQLNLLNIIHIRFWIHASG